MNTFRRISFLIGRILISLIFILSGIGKIMNWHEINEELMMKLCHWHSVLETYAFGADLVEPLITSPSILQGIAVVLELAGAIFLILGYRIRLGAFLLLLFMVPVTLIYHDFWFQEGAQVQTELVMFLKNLAIIGGLIIIAFGPQLKGKSE